jgi:hypothetical protein
MTVTGAGTSAINGADYVLTGTTDGTDYWFNGTYYLFRFSSYIIAGHGTGFWLIADQLSAGATHTFYANPSLSDTPPGAGWFTDEDPFVSGDDPAPTISNAGGDGGPYTETTDTESNTTAKVFGVGGGEITPAVDGEIITITNAPQENGLFRTSVTTRTAKPLRTPATEGAFLGYASNFFPNEKAFILGRNRTYGQFLTDMQLLNQAFFMNRINNVSSRVNNFGLYDYTITSNEPG